MNTTTRRHDAFSIRGTAAVIALASLLSCGGNKTPTSVDTPDPNAVASVQVSPGSAVLASLGDTTRLVATVTNSTGTPLARPVTWTSSDPAVASVDSDGNVVAISNGTATVTATADTASANAGVTVAQVVAALSVESGEAQGNDIGATLDSVVVLLASDARGNPVAGASIALQDSIGGGSPAESSITTDADGFASVSWVLGLAVGPQLLVARAGDAVATVTAFGYPLQAALMRAGGPFFQEELYGQPLWEPWTVEIVDSLGNPVPDVPVVFSNTGSGTLDGDTVRTDLDGRASVRMTLGNNGFERDSVFAVVPDSAVADIVDFPGSPVIFRATAYGLFIDTSPDPGRPGDTVTVMGQGFPVDVTTMPVTLSGIPATVVGGTQREVSFVVPDFGCSPEIDRRLNITRDTFSVTVQMPVTPRDQLDLTPGQKVTIPDGRCIQLPGGTDSEYLVGVTATKALDAAGTFRLSAWDSVGSIPAAPVGPTRVAPRTLQHFTTRYQGEAKLRRWEEAFTATMSTSATSGPLAAPGAPMAAPAGPAPAPPLVGDALTLRLPNLLGDACLSYTDIAADVFWVGSRLSLSSTEPIAQPLDVGLLAALNSLETVLDDATVDLVAGFLGLPDDWGPDTRINVVLTPGVTPMGVSSFSTAVDQLPRATCPASDEGRYVYVAIPTAATGLQIASALANKGPDLAHEIAHIVQSGRRFAAGGSLLPAWLAEGQALAAAEAAGLAVVGLAAQGNHGSPALSLPGADSWLSPRLDALALFNGWDGAAGTNAGAPEGCSLFGFAGPQVPCAPEYTTGAGWSFVRYLGDRFGAATGDESVFHQALLDAGAGVDPLQVWATLSGLEFAEAMTDWAAMLYTDGRLTPAQAPALQLTSWDLLSALPAGVRRLAPDTRGFVDFSRTGSVLGGGTAYTLIGDGSAHGPLSIVVDDGAGGAIAPELAPRVWVVRVR
jgi:hypothetical protein